MRLFQLLRGAAFVALLLFGLALPAWAGDWSLSKTPEGQDILRHCRAALDQDIQLQLKWGLTLPTSRDERDRGLLEYWVFHNWELTTQSTIPSTIEYWEKKMRDDPREWHHSTVCALRRRLQQLQNPGLVGGHSGSAQTPSAKPAPKAAAPAEKLRPARPIKMAPWSPKALSNNTYKVLSPHFAVHRVDALASCSAPLQQWATTESVPATETILLAEDSWLYDEFMNHSAERVRVIIGQIEQKISDGNLDQRNLAAHRASRCVFQRRLAQLEGSPLSTGAVDGTLTPLSIGSPGPPWKQQGKDARIIASDGKSAMDCVKLIEVTKTDSGLGGGGRVLSNQCSGPVEITWCYSPGDCDTETGSGWTVQAGKSWPVSAVKQIRWAACHGRETASFVKGSYGLRYYCKAPAKK